MRLVGDILFFTRVSTMTWNDLLNFLVQAKDKQDINMDAHVMIHNAETGDEYPTDTWVISDSRGNDRLVLVINSEDIYK